MEGMMLNQSTLGQNSSDGGFTENGTYLVPSTDTPSQAATLLDPCRNPELNLLSLEAAQLVELVLHAGLFPVLVAIGVTTNVFNLVVFVRQGLADRINLCLFSLAVADLGYLLLLMATKSYTLLGLVDAETGSYWSQRYLNTLLGVFLGFLNISNAMTTLISVERCICVLAPFRAKRLFKTRYMAVGIVCIYVYVLGLYGLLLVKYVTVRVPPDPSGSNVTRYMTRLGDFYLRHRVAIDILYNYLLSIAIPATSLVTVIVTSSVTVLRLRAWHRQSADVVTSSSQRREAAVTHMLATLCCVYVICMTPSVTVAFARNLVPGYLPNGRYCNLFKMTTALVHTLEAVNSSTNFYIYYSRGSKFRATFLQLFCHFRRGGKGGAGTKEVTSRTSASAQLHSASPSTEVADSDVYQISRG